MQHNHFDSQNFIKQNNRQISVENQNRNELQTPNRQRRIQKIIYQFDIDVHHRVEIDQLFQLLDSAKLHTSVQRNFDLVIACSVA